MVERSEGVSRDGTRAHPARNGPVAALIACLLVLAGCFGGAAQDDETRQGALPGVHPDDSLPAVPGGVFRIAARADAPSLDPLKESANSTHIAVGYVYSKLVDYKVGKDTPFGTHQLEGDLAEAWETSPDGLSWTFHLRHGVRFQNVAPVNGREFTSADVACTLDAVRERGQQRGDIGMIQSWDTPDPYTVVFTLASPYPDLAAKFAGHFLWMLPCEGTEGRFDLATRAIGTGPFMLTKWNKDKERTYAKNPDYYVAGKPYLDGLHVIVIPDTAAASAALRTKKVDLVATVTDMASVRALVKSDPDIYVAKELAYQPTIVYMNQAVKPFDDLRVRKAVAMSIDRADMLTSIRPGGLISGPVTPKVAGALSPAEVRELQPYDPERARKLLAEAGLANGFTTKMIVTNGYSDTVVREAQWVQEDLGKVGIKVEIDMQDYATYFTKSWAGKDYAIGAGLQTPWLTADDMLISQWYSRGTRNWFNIDDPHLDQMILAQRAVQDPARRLEALKDIQRYIIDKVSNPLPLYIYESIVLYGGYMHDIHPQPDYGSRDYMNMWMDKDAPGRTGG
ncbi:ABC transporter substrate-binding protein [Mangrovihabitans endophyticus]|uniref:ABC transporter substrate-binding protein n=1 Tax=Mangrovihabitans endophyticus TaxID=1751298 RepID=A0A8J3BSP6_9ACTN|nr:ABC transporter substrate-binding protein [Mangrovihabitans endophyticus]GGK74761.1 ABC transporter substrate-binding protein [Mangrovihabitans endophyticus]